MKIENVFERSFALLASQFQDKLDGDLTNFQKFVKVFSIASQEIQNIIEEIRKCRSLDYAEGVQLDRLGDIIGLPRGSKTDDEYREALKFQAFVNQSKGTAEDIITYLRYQTGGTRIDIEEVFPAAFIAITNGSIKPRDKQSLNRSISSVSAAGVKMIALVREDDDAPYRLAEHTKSGLYYAPNSLRLAEVGKGREQAGSLNEALISNIL